ITKETVQLSEGDNKTSNLDYNVKLDDTDKITVHIDPNKPLNPGKQYTVIVNKNIKDIQGNTFGDNVWWTFETKEESTDKKDESLAIEDNTRIPITGTPNVDPATKEFSFEFNKKINKDSISKTKNVHLIEINTTTTPNTTKSIPISDVNVVEENDKSKVIIKTASNLKPKTQYRIIVDTDVKDLQNKPLGTEKTPWTFETK